MGGVDRAGRSNVVEGRKFPTEILVLPRRQRNFPRENLVPRREQPFSRKNLVPRWECRFSRKRFEISDDLLVLSYFKFF